MTESLPFCDQFIYCTYIIERTCIKQRYKVKAKQSGLFILSLFTRLRREVLAAHIARALYANNATCSIQGRKKTKMLHYRIAPRVEFYFILSQSITRTERPPAPSDLCFELRIRNMYTQLSKIKSWKQISLGDHYTRSNYIRNQIARCTLSHLAYLALRQTWRMTASILLRRGQQDIETHEWYYTMYSKYLENNISIQKKYFFIVKINFFLTFWVCSVWTLRFLACQVLSAFIKVAQTGVFK